MNDALPVSCPQCAELLEPGHRNGLSTWHCSKGHGVAINLLEAYRHLQLDELEAIWSGVHQAPISNLRSPVDNVPMVQVTFPVDDDFRIDGVVTDTEMTIEVDVKHYVGWFSFEELKSMPAAPARPVDTELVGLTAFDDTTAEAAPIFANLTADDFGPDEDAPGPQAQTRFARLIDGVASRFKAG